MKYKLPLIRIALLGASAVILGAFGAHGLKGKMAEGLITPDQLNGFDTAVRYQIYHTLAIFCVLIFRDHYPHSFLRWASHCFMAGIVLFSGSLYLLCTRNLTGAEYLSFLGPLTPIGGLFFVAGWLLIFASAFRSPNN